MLYWSIKFKPNPTEEQIQLTEILLPDLEALLYKNPEQVAGAFLNNTAFREYLLSRTPPEELAKAEKIAKEQNTTTTEIIKRKLIEILRKEKKPESKE